jgi:hypothetical protein
MSSDTLGRHTFLPWLRRGVGTRIARLDGDVSGSARASLDVSVAIGGGPLSHDPLAVHLDLYGPGDVKAFDMRAVVRTWPRADVHEAEPNYFPLVELDPPDLPWRYTPARANARDRLRPWLVVIALTDDEIVRMEGPTASRGAGVVTVTSGSALPILDQSWAWAHVQVTGESGLDAVKTLEILEHEPRRAVARLLCPRRLEPHTAYTGILVPAFEHGRLAGLGQRHDASTDAMAPAWTATSENVALPIFHKWRFTTGGEGDFESLVRRVQPRHMPPTVGSRPMNVAAPGQGLPAAATTPLNLEGALLALDSVSTVWPSGRRAAWTTALQTLVNQSHDRLAQPNAPVIVGPPLYGRWHAKRARLESGQTPPWFQDLNADPRLRTTAGLGTMVVQRHQQALVAGAWAQVEGIREANAELRYAQLAREAAVRIFDRHVAVRATASLLAFSAPVHSRVMAAATTVRSVLGASPLASGVLAPPWRRLARPRGALGRRLTRLRSAAPALSFLERVNRGDLRAAPPAVTPATLVTLERIAEDLAPPWLTGAVRDRLAALARTDPAAHAALRDALPASAPAADAPAVAHAALRDGTLSGSHIRSVSPRGSFVPMATTGWAERLPVAAPSAADHPAAARFRRAIGAVFDELQELAEPAPTVTVADLQAVRPRLLAALDPRETVAAAYRGRLTLADGAPRTTADPLDAVMAAPRFEQPMYKPLADLSQDWLLPGLDAVPADTVAVLKTNQRFVESYMVGLNHEMARELLFNEYPTDQRGTYFRQFWDSSAAIVDGAPADPSMLRDIRPIHEWPPEAGVGANSSRPASSEFLVLLVRAELLRRYPNTIVYAARAKWTTDGSVRDVDLDQELYPQFSGTLGAGVGFWGFALERDHVRGGDAPPDDPGWYFVLQEPHMEPRFGLDVPNGFGGRPTTWNALAWGHLATSAADLSAINYLDLNASLPDTAAVVSAQPARWHADQGTGPAGARASDLAYITYRVPVRIAIHAAQLVPR